MMALAKDNIVQPCKDSIPSHTISCYSNTSITVNKTCYQHPILLCPDQGVTPWRLNNITEIHIDHLKQIIAYCKNTPKIIILGAGHQQHWLTEDQLRYCHVQHIGIEIMPTASACRTYNLLASDQLPVLAALWVDPISSGPSH